MKAETFEKLAAILPEVTFATKKWMLDIGMSWDENNKLDNVDEDQHFVAFSGGKWFYDEEITKIIVRKADYLECSDGEGWTIWFGRYCTEAALEQAFDEGFRWSLECDAEFGELTNEQLDTIAECGVELDFADRNREWNNEQEAEQEAAEQEAEQAEQEAERAEQAEQEADSDDNAHHTIYDTCTPAWTPAFSYDVSHARTVEEQMDLIERARAQEQAPASSDVQDETWFCGCATQPTDADADTAVQDADVACLTREAEDRLYHQRAAERAAERAERRGPVAFVVSILFIIILLGGAGTLAHALTTTAPALTGATAITGDIMATRIPAQKTKATATPAPAETPTATATPAPAETPTATATPAPAPATATPTLAELLARALEARDSTPAPTPAPEQVQPKAITLKTALKRALLAPRTGTTECVIYSTLYSAIRIEEVTTPAPAEDADEQATSAWTIASDTRRVVFLRELKNVSRGRTYCEQITALLDAIDATDDDYVWHTATFGSLPADLKKAIKDQFDSDACTDDERAECRDALDPTGERVTLHRAAIETACERLARMAPEWAPLLYEETPAPATLRQGILELQYCIYPIDSSPRARVFRGLEGIDFRTLSAPEDYIMACRAASLRAGEPSTAIPPEARARIMQWRSGSVTSTPTAVTSTAARLAAVWGMD